MGYRAQKKVRRGGRTCVSLVTYSYTIPGKARRTHATMAYPVTTEVLSLYRSQVRMLKAAGDGGREEGRQGERNEEDTSISTDI